MTQPTTVMAYGTRSLAAVALLWASAAYAQDATGYDTLVDQGLAAFEQERWADAYQLFDRAHALEPNARTLRARGIASYKQGALVNALIDLRAALVETRRPLTAELTAAVQELVGRIESQLARLRMHVRPSSARVQVDGELVAPTPEGDLFLAPGPHRLQLSADGYTPFERELVVAQGSATDLVVELAVVATTPAQPSHAQPLPAPGSQQAAARATRDRAAPPGATASDGPSSAPLWISGAATAGFALAAAGFWLAGTSEVEDVGEECRTRRCSPAQRELAIDQSAIGTYETLTTGSLVLSGASLVAFGAAWVWFAGHDARHDRLRARPQHVELRF